MRKLKSLLLGAAGSAMIATGALAADVLAVAVAATPAPTPVAAGPEVAIDITTEVAIWVPALQAFGGTGGMVDVTSATGWGVRFEGYSYLYLPGPNGAISGTTTLYRSFGDFEAGVWGGAGFGWLCCGFDYGVGVSLNYEQYSDTLYIKSENGFQIFPSVDFYSHTVMEYNPSERLNVSAYLDIYAYGDWEFAVGVDFDVNDRLEVWSNIYLEQFGFDYLEFGVEFAINDRFSVWSWLGFDNSPFQFDWFEIGMTFEIMEGLEINAELDFEGGPFALDYAEVWAELDRQIGTGPLSVIGEVGIGWDAGLYGWANIGVRYKLGGKPDREDTRLLYY